MTITDKRGSERQMIVDTVSEIAQEYGHDYWRDCVDRGAFPRELWDELGTLGYLGLTIPEEYGGEGMGMTELAAFIETFASHGVPSLTFVSTMTMAPLPIAYHGSDDLKERFLPGIATGDLLVAFAITEPDAGTNSFKIQTSAVRDGDEYVINGQKTFITGAKDADYIQLVARTTPYEEVRETKPTEGGTLMTVSTDSEGIEMQPLDLAIPEPVAQYTVHFDDVRVPVENRIGTEGEGFRHVFDALNPERIATSALSIGLGTFVLNRAAEYAQDRVVFDSPIGAHQGVQHSLARAKVDLELAALANRRAAEAFDAGRSPTEVGTYSNVAKLSSSEAADQAMDVAMQTHGGNAFSRDYDIVTLRPWTRLLRIAPVNNQIVLSSVAENLLGLPRSY